MGQTERIPTHAAKSPNHFTQSAWLLADPLPSAMRWGMKFPLFARLLRGRAYGSAPTPIAFSHATSMNWGSCRGMVLGAGALKEVMGPGAMARVVGPRGTRRPLPPIGHLDASFPRPPSGQHRRRVFAR